MFTSFVRRERPKLEPPLRRISLSHGSCGGHHVAPQRPRGGIPLLHIYRIGPNRVAVARTSRVTRTLLNLTRINLYITHARARVRVTEHTAVFAISGAVSLTNITWPMYVRARNANRRYGRPAGRGPIAPRYPLSDISSGASERMSGREAARSLSLIRRRRCGERKQRRVAPSNSALRFDSFRRIRTLSR